MLFTVLWTAKDRMRATGALTSLFITLYGVFRFAVEFFREPDPQLGFVLGPFTMGQVLSASMALAGFLLLCTRIKKTRASATSK